MVEIMADYVVPTLWALAALGVFVNLILNYKETR